MQWADFIQWLKMLLLRIINTLFRGNAVLFTKCAMKFIDISLTPITPSKVALTKMSTNNPSRKSVVLELSVKSSLASRTGSQDSRTTDRMTINRQLWTYLRDWMPWSAKGYVISWPWTYTRYLWITLPGLMTCKSYTLYTNIDQQPGVNVSCVLIFCWTKPWPPYRWATVQLLAKQKFYGSLTSGDNFSRIH